MSHAVERNCSGSNSLFQNETFVGTSPTVMTRIGGVPVKGLVDTGSMVTLVTEAFYREKLQTTLGDLYPGTRVLQLRGANGLDIPYIGYIVATVEIGGAMVPECVIFITKDTSATTVMQRRVPVLLGTNVLGQVPQYQQILQDGKKMKLKTRFVKVAGSDKVWVPPYTESDVLVTGPSWGTDAEIEPLGVPVEGNLTVASTLVDTANTCYYVRVANQTAKDIWLKPRTRDGIVREGEMVKRGEQLEFRQENNTVTVCCTLSA